MIMGNSIAHSGCAFHPSIAEPPVSIEGDREGGEEGEKQKEEDGPSMNLSTMQGLVVSALTTASAATSSQFPHQNTSNLPTTSTLINEFHVPNDMMEIDPIPKMMGDCLPTLSPSATLPKEVAMSISGGNKCKFHSTVHSAPASVISAAPSAPTTFTPSSSDPLLSLSLVTKHHKASLSGTSVSLHLLSSSSTRGHS